MFVYVWLNVLLVCFFLIGSYVVFQSGCLMSSCFPGLPSRPLPRPHYPSPPFSSTCQALASPLHASLQGLPDVNLGCFWFLIATGLHTNQEIRTSNKTPLEDSP